MRYVTNRQTCTQKPYPLPFSIKVLQCSCQSPARLKCCGGTWRKARESWSNKSGKNSSTTMWVADKTEQTDKMITWSHSSIKLPLQVIETRLFRNKNSDLFKCNLFVVHLNLFFLSLDSVSTAWFFMCSYKNIFKNVSINPLNLNCYYLF